MQATRVDVLAPAVGNTHGLLKSMVKGEAEKHLKIDLIGEIKRSARVFMTLHGGSGTNLHDITAAIGAGINIVHVNTELRLARRKGLEDALSSHPSELAPYKILPHAVAAVRQFASERLRVFASSRKPLTQTV